MFILLFAEACSLDIFFSPNSTKGSEFITGTFKRLFNSRLVSKQHILLPILGANLINGQPKCKDSCVFEQTILCLYNSSRTIFQAHESLIQFYLQPKSKNPVNNLFITLYSKQRDPTKAFECIEERRGNKLLKELLTEKRLPESKQEVVIIGPNKTQISEQMLHFNICDKLPEDVRCSNQIFNF